MTTPYYSDDAVTLYHGDCLDVLRELPDASVDAVVTDPPYGLGFMGKAWDGPGKAFVERKAERRNVFDHVGGNHNPADSADQQRTRLRENAGYGAWCESWAVECLRVLKPGGHMLAFGGSRTWHRLASAIEDAGFEIRDSIAWLYGSGFPKSLDVCKAIDRSLGVEREPDVMDGREQVVGNSVLGKGLGVGILSRGAAGSEDAARWQGWGTALKPAFEPIVVARKPLAGTVAANVLAHGTGALNVDACRVGDDERETTRSNGVIVSKNGSMSGGNTGRVPGPIVTGRWPTNVVLDESQAAELDRQTGVRTSGSRKPGTYVGLGYMGSESADFPGITGDQGGASRFFPTFRYEAKAPTSERPRDGEVAHPTVKPLDLMHWLVRLVTPPGGIVLEPFAGSGTTAEACVIEGFRCIAIEREADYLPLIVQRLTKPIALTLDLDGGAA